MATALLELGLLRDGLSDATLYLNIETLASPIISDLQRRKKKSTFPMWIQVLGESLGS
jgi:hypothetical protein